MLRLKWIHVSENDIAGEMIPKVYKARKSHRFLLQSVENIISAVSMP